MYKTIGKTGVLLVLSLVSTAARPWWNWGPAEWMGGLIGGVGLNFGLSISAGGHSGTRYYDYFDPYAAPAPLAPPARLQGSPYAGLPRGEAQADEAVARAVEAQRKFAEELASRHGLAPRSTEPATAGTATAVGASVGAGDRARPPQLPHSGPFGAANDARGFVPSPGYWGTVPPQEGVVSGPAPRAW